MPERKLVAIYNYWGNPKMLELSIERMGPLVDGVLVIASTVSNYGEEELMPASFERKYDIIIFNPTNGDPRQKETDKRNRGLDEAIKRGYTHFLTCDEDEFYEPEEFRREWARFENPDLLGLVCRVKCYFKSPTLTIGYDTTLVPFIHKLTPNLCHEFNRNYPFAWTKTNGTPFTQEKQIRIDPTRSLNINSGVEWSDITMHHLSWVRSDIRKKIRNSTARQNIERSTIVTDYVNAKEGYFCHFYGKVLQVTPNIFGLPEINDTSIQSDFPPAGSTSTD